MVRNIRRPQARSAEHKSVKISAYSLLVPALALLLSLGACASSPSGKPGRMDSEQDLGIAFSEYYADHGIQSTESSRPKVYFTSDEWYERALELVENAKDYILVSSFLINSHKVNATILSALKRKAEENVRVYVIDRKSVV